jgi:predicted nuclease of predicted toxin-antitoxin system
LKFKIDENLPQECALLLQAAGFLADTVAEEGLAGSPDSLLALMARADDRVLVTLDLDFADIRSYPPGDLPGIVILRPRSQNKQTILALLQNLIPVLLRSSPERRLWIVEHDRIRYRDE